MEELQVENCMFTLTLCDVISRLSYPLILNMLKFSSRFMFLIGVVGLAIVRIIFLAVDLEDYQYLLILCAVLGFFRSLTVVNQVLIICDFCEDNCPAKLPGTLGLSVVIKATMLVIFGSTFNAMHSMTIDLTMNFYSQIGLFVIVIFIWIFE